MSERVLQRDRPDVGEAMKTFQGEVRRKRFEAMVVWAQSSTRLLNTPAASSRPAHTRAVETAFEKFHALLPEIPQARRAEMPVSDFAFWLAREAFEKEKSGEGKLRKTSQWVAKAYLAQPRSKAAGRALMLVANHSLTRSIQEMDEEQANLAAVQFHLAYSAFGEAFPRLKIDALWGMARALSRVGYKAFTPFEPATPARWMALRCLLQLVEPGGTLRSETAAILPKEQRAGFERDAGDLLFALRRIAAWSRIALPNLEPLDCPLDSTGGHGADTLVLHEAGNPFVVHFIRPTSPDRPGLPGPGFTETAVVRLEERIRRLFPERASHVFRIACVWCLRLLKEEPSPQYFFTYRDDTAGEDLLLGFKDLNAERPFLTEVFTPQGFHIREHLRLGDVDEDGITDLLVGLGHFHRKAYVIFQRKDGSLSKRVLLPPIRGGSDIQDLFVGNLDRKGKSETVILRGPFHDYALDILHYKKLDEGFQFTRVGQAPAGITRRIVTLETKEGILLALSPTIPDLTTSHAFHIMGRPLPHVGIRIYRWKGPEGGLEPLQKAGTVRSFDYRAPVWEQGRLLGPPVSGMNRLALIEAGGRKNQITRLRVPFLKWHFWEGARVVDRPFRTLTIPHQKGLYRMDRPEGLRFGTETVARDLSQADLEVAAERPPPKSAFDQASAPSVSLGGFLLGFGLPQSAVGFARRRAREVKVREVALALKRMELAGRMESGDAEGLKEALSALKPDRGLEAAVLFAADWLGDRHREYAWAASLLEMWGTSARVPENERKILARRAATWKKIHTLLEKPTVTLEGENVLTPAGKSKIWDHVVVNRPELLTLSGGEKANRALQFSFRERPTLAIVKPAETGAASKIYPSSLCAGIPVRFLGGSWRLKFDVFIQGVHWFSGIRFGLCSLECFLGEWGSGKVHDTLRFDCLHGGNEVTTVDFITACGELKIDALVGKPFRVDVEYVAERRILRCRVTVLGEDRCVFNTASRKPNPLGGGDFFLGLYGDAPHLFEGVIHRLQFMGRAYILPPGDPIVRGIIDSTENLPPLCRAVRCRMAGKDREAARHFADTAQRCLKAMEGLGPDDEIRLQGNLLAEGMRFESLWCESDGDADRFAERLGPFLTDEERVCLLYYWLKGLPRFSPDSGLWEGCGKAFAQARFKGLDPEAVFERIITEKRTYQAMRREFNKRPTPALGARLRAIRSGMKLHTGAVIGLWLLSRSPKDANLRAHVIDFMHLIEEGPWVIQLSEDLSGIAKERDRHGLMGMRADALLTFHRRREALEVLEAGGEPTYRMPRDFLEFLIRLRNDQLVHGAEGARTAGNRKD
ncbi:MAG: hypothetical protein ACYTHN_05950 [Planctomycetota bacterium]|jgi:hypothetical protein